MTFLLRPFDLKCRALLDATPKRTSRHCLRSAFHHLEMADKIAVIDPAMAAFRTLTAVEEGASGLMHCLKERRYKNSGLLKPRDHFQKNAITPFLDVLGLAFSEILKSNKTEPGFLVKEIDGEQRLTACLKIPDDPEEKWIFPNPPLNFTLTYDGRPLSYKTHIARYVEHRGVKDVTTHLRTEANLRNKLLYAGPDGYPSGIDLAANFIEHRTVRVLALVRAYLLIQPYPGHLPFVQDALNAFLSMLGALDNHELNDEV